MGSLRGKASGLGPAVRALVLGLTLAGSIAAQRGPRASEDPGDGLVERVFSGQRTPAELRRRLGGVDVVEIPRLFHLAAEGRLPGDEGSAFPPLDEAERQAVREALCARPRREIVPFLEDLASFPIEPVQRREGQRLLGCMGSADHLKLLARLTQPFQERGTLAPELRAGFSAAMGAILARDAAALGQVRALFSECPPGLASSIVEALAGVKTGAATRVLAELLGRSPGLDPLLLARLAERGRLREPGSENVFETVRRYLKKSDPALVSAAALACGRLGDDGAVETLIQLVDHADERVRARVFAALEEISGLALGREGARWASWYQAEMRWWEDEAEYLLLRVERGRGLEFVRAARAVLEHRLFRDRVAEAFAQTLQRGGYDEVLLACRALEQLRSPLAARGLLECLDRPDPLVRAAAWKALRATPGVELPSEGDPWAALGG